MSYLQLVNGSHPLPRSFVPEDLVSFTNFEGTNVQVVSTVLDHFHAMRFDGMESGQLLDITSGYRSFDHQQQTFDRIVAHKGPQAAGKVVAYPGTSEHQLGLGIDVSNFTPGGVMRSDPQRFEWLHQHCYDYGFIVRYQKAYQPFTGVNEEPWHLRYVGVEHAKQIQHLNISLEQYLLLLHS